MCVCPVTNKLEIYCIVNGKKDINNINGTLTISTHDHIIDIIKNMLMSDYTLRDKCNDIYTNITTNFNQSGYVVSKKENFIEVLYNDSGYYIYFDLLSYACIGVIQNNQYYKSDNIRVNDYQELINKLNELILEQYMSNIKYYDIINSKYLECDISDINIDCTNDNDYRLSSLIIPSTVDSSDNNSVNSSIDYDPQ